MSEVSEIKSDKQVRTEEVIQGEYTQACMKFGDLAFKARINKENYEQMLQQINQQMENIIKAKKKLGDELREIKESKPSEEVKVDETH
jgi:hypothetical protein